MHNEFVRPMPPQPKAAPALPEQNRPGRRRHSTPNVAQAERTPDPAGHRPDVPHIGPPAAGGLRRRRPASGFPAHRSAWQSTPGRGSPDRGQAPHRSWSGLTGLVAPAGPQVQELAALLLTSCSETGHKGAGSCEVIHLGVGLARSDVRAALPRLPRLAPRSGVSRTNPQARSGAMDGKLRVWAILASSWCDGGRRQVKGSAASRRGRWKNVRRRSCR